MSITIHSKPLSGNVTIPPSKSMSHRLILCAGLAKGESVIQNVALSEDIKVTLDAVKAMGRQVTINEDTVSILGELSAPNITIDCNESGSSLRFLIPMISALGGGQLTGQARLGERPLNVYQDVFRAQGLSLNQGFPLDIPGGLDGGMIHVSGQVSSQFISGLMLAAPLMHRDINIVLTTPLESKAYVEMTIQAMKTFGVTVQTVKENQEYIIKAEQAYQPAKARVEADWSQSGFWFLAGLSSEKGIVLDGPDMNSAQGDKAIIDILNEMGANIMKDDNALTIKKTALKPANIDISQCPDLAPVVAGLMALTDQPCMLTGCARLRIKESDRIASIVETLNGLGGYAEADGDTIKINGRPNGGHVKSYNDHRIAMMAAALSAHCEDSVTIDDERVVNKSYPAFWSDFRNLGGSYE